MLSVIQGMINRGLGVLGFLSIPLTILGIIMLTTGSTPTPTKTSTIGGFNIGEFIKYGWSEAKETVVARAGFIIGYFVLVFGAGFLLEIVAPTGPGVEPSISTILPVLGGQIVVNILGLVFGMAIVAGAATIVYRGSQGFGFGDFFEKLGPAKFFRVLGASILVGIFTMIGFVLLIIPGIIVAIRLKYFMHAIIQDNMGVIESIKYSWAITKGYFWKIFGFGIVQGLVTFLGALVFLVGLLWSLPTAYIADMKSYKFLTGGKDSTPAPTTDEETMTVEQAQAIIDAN